MQLYETKNLRIKPFTKAEMHGRYSQWFHDQEVTKHNSHGLFPYTPAQQEEFLQSLERDDKLVWAVFIKHPDPNVNHFSNTLHIGNIALQRIDWINRSAEFACVFGEKKHWGKGYCTEAAQVLFDHGFNKLNLNRIWTGTAATNIGMQKVAAKLGMTKEGEFRSGVFLNGKYENIIVYGLLEKERGMFKVRQAVYVGDNDDEIITKKILEEEKIKTFLNQRYLIMTSNGEWYRSHGLGTTRSIKEAHFYSLEEMNKYYLDSLPRVIPLPAIMFYYSPDIKSEWIKRLKEKGLI